MTKDQLRQNAAAMIAFADGKPVQAANLGSDNWHDRDDPTDAPTWNFYTYEYRPKPDEPKVRPWNCPADVPLNCWIRRATPPNDACSFIVGIGNVGVAFYRYQGTGPVCAFVEWSKLGKFQYSTDRVLWKPCTVTEEV